MGSIMAAIVRAIETAAAAAALPSEKSFEGIGRKREEADLPPLLLRYRIFLSHISILLLHSSYSVLGRNVVRFLLIKMF